MKEIKRCPYCGKEILSIAKKCRYCGKWLPENENLSSSEKKWHFINDKKIIILGILVFLVIIVWSGLGVSQTDNNAQIKQNDPVINFGEQKQDDKSIVMPEKLERKPTVPKEIIDESNVSSDMQNSIDGLLALGERYENGVGVEVNLDLAFSYYYSAAEYGDPVALNKIGNMYANGKGCEQNMYKAAIFYKKAAEKGNKYAQHNLAFCYWDGAGIEKNHEVAIMWMRRSASQGYEKAKMALKTMGVND